MDWIRRMMGSSDRSQSEDFRNPTWNEIIKQQYSDNRPQPPNEPHRDFPHMGGSFDIGGSFSMGDDEDVVNAIFGQMDSMFRQMDSLMQGFHTQSDNFIEMDPPDLKYPTEPDQQSPRDSYLKEPDRENQRENRSPYFHHHSPFRGPPLADPKIDGDHPFDMGPGGNFHMHDPFRMMDEFMQSFGGGLFGGMGPFWQDPSVPSLPSPEEKIPDNPRESLIKKEDTDLDEEITGGFSNLLKDMPRYDPPGVRKQPNEDQINEFQPQSNHSYHSSVIVRIRGPDGSMKETKTYRDSSGREEVIVTETQPNDNAPPGSPGSLLKKDPEMFNEQSHSSHWSSVFNWFSGR